MKQSQRKPRKNENTKTRRGETLLKNNMKNAILDTKKCELFANISRNGFWSGRRGIGRRGRRRSASARRGGSCRGLEVPQLSPAPLGRMSKNMYEGK